MKYMYILKNKGLLVSKRRNCTEIATSYFRKSLQKLLTKRAHTKNSLFRTFNIYSFYSFLMADIVTALLALVCQWCTPSPVGEQLLIFEGKKNDPICDVTVYFSFWTQVNLFFPDVLKVYLWAKNIFDMWKSYISVSITPTLREKGYI